MLIVIAVLCRVGWVVHIVSRNLEIGTFLVGTGTGGCVLAPCMCPLPNVLIPRGSCHSAVWSQRSESWALSGWEAGIAKAFLSPRAGPAGAFPPSGELEQLTEVGRCKMDLEKTWTDHIPANPCYNMHCPVPLTKQRRALQCQDSGALGKVGREPGLDVLCSLRVAGGSCKKQHSHNWELT